MGAGRDARRAVAAARAAHRPEGLSAPARPAAAQPAPQHAGTASSRRSSVLESSSSDRPSDAGWASPVSEVHDVVGEQRADEPARRAEGGRVGDGRRAAPAAIVVVEREALAPRRLLAREAAGAARGRTAGPRARAAGTAPPPRTGRPPRSTAASTQRWSSPTGGSARSSDEVVPVDERRDVLGARRPCGRRRRPRSSRSEKARSRAAAADAFGRPTSLVAEEDLAVEVARARRGRRRRRRGGRARRRRARTPSSSRGRRRRAASTEASRSARLHGRTARAATRPRRRSSAAGGRSARARRRVAARRRRGVLHAARPR